MAVSSKLKTEICPLLGQLRWMLLPKKHYGNSLIGYGLNTQPSIGRRTINH